MALNPERINFLIRQIQNSDFRTFRSTVSQIFSYLSKEVKDNPIYDKYENERQKWSTWPMLGKDEMNFDSHEWELPEDLDETKSLTYDIYKSIGLNEKDWVINFSFSLFGETRLSDNFDKLNQTFLGYFSLALEDIVNANPEIEDASPKRVNNKITFIVHGHDNELKTELQLLLKRAGVQSIVLHEQADKGRTIIDKLIGETNSAGYAIALLTPDDLTKDGSSRARQNVILEIGYFLGL